jgi:TolB-like protein/DNA-binding winged helix-turn-helix (wHTH) protein
VSITVPERVVARFGQFTLLREPLELFRERERLRLQDLPLRVLALLVSRPGQLVTREELIAQLWPKGVVEFDTGLNTAMRKLRVALADDADSPRLIETVPRQGYRFIGMVGGEASAAAIDSSARPADRQQPATRRRRFRLTTALIFGLVLLLSVAGWLRPLFFAADPSSLDARYRLAVLPFDNLSPDPGNAFFADGMHEEVLSALDSRAPEIEVISRSTMMLYRDVHQSVAAIARELEASHVLEGTVRRDGERVRMTVALIDAQSDSQVWSRRYDLELRDAMTLQAAVASEVAAQLAAELSPDPMRLPPSRNLQAYDLWLKGVLEWQQVGGAAPTVEIERVESMFTRAIELDDSYAAAYADRARVRIAQFFGGKDESAANADAARADIAMARSLAGDAPYVLMRAAQLAMLVDGDMDEALALIARAEAAGPLTGDFLMTKGSFLAFAGRLDAASVIHEQAASTDPGNPTIFRFWMRNLLSGGRIAEALQIAENFEARSVFRIERGEAVFAYTGSSSRWRDERDLAPVAEDPFERLSIEADLLRLEGRLGELEQLLVNAGEALFWQHSIFGQIAGETDKPVAELRGWHRLLSGDSKGAALEGQAIARFVAGRTRTTRNDWWLTLMDAESALFVGDTAAAVSLAQRALAQARSVVGVAATVYAQARVARILAWASAENEAVALLEQLAAGNRRLGPASIVRDPLYSVPLAGQGRYDALKARLESEIAGNQVLLK